MGCHYLCFIYENSELLFGNNSIKIASGKTSFVYVQLVATDEVILDSPKTDGKMINDKSEFTY